MLISNNTQTIMRFPILELNTSYQSSVMEEMIYDAFLHDSFSRRHLICSTKSVHDQLHQWTNFLWCSTPKYHGETHHIISMTQAPHKPCEQPCGPSTASRFCFWNHYKLNLTRHRSSWAPITAGGSMPLAVRSLGSEGLKSITVLSVESSHIWHKVVCSNKKQVQCKGHRTTIGPSKAVRGPMAAPDGLLRIGYLSSCLRYTFMKSSLLIISNSHVLLRKNKLTCTIIHVPTYYAHRWSPRWHARTDCTCMRFWCA